MITDKPPYKNPKSNTWYKKIFQWFLNRDIRYRSKMYFKYTLKERIRREQPDHWLNLKKYGGTKYE